MYTTVSKQSTCVDKKNRTIIAQEDDLKFCSHWFGRKIK